LRQNLEKMSLPKVEYQDLGRIRYQTAWDYQFETIKKVIDVKREVREATPSVSDPIFKENLIKTQLNYLLFCEHHPVYTLGKSGSLDNLLLNQTELAAQDIEFFKINRGGDITYHGDGQITGYPIFDLDCFFTDVHKYVRSLEEVMIRTIAEYGLEGTRIKDYTGVWLENGDKKRKICAIGVHLSRWVTMHGFALNVNTPLSFFNNIIPCGIEDADKTVTSLAAELGRNVDMDEIKERVKYHFSEVFGFAFV
jgi:lipoyl(octanoyl) transferase